MRAQIVAIGQEHSDFAMPDLLATLKQRTILWSEVEIFYGFLVPRTLLNGLSAIINDNDFRHRSASRKPAQEPLDLAVKVLAHGLLQAPGIQTLQQVRLKGNLLAVDGDGREPPDGSDQFVAVVDVPARQPRQFLDLGLVDEDRLQLGLLSWSGHFTL